MTRQITRQRAAMTLDKTMQRAMDGWAIDKLRASAQDSVRKLRFLRGRRDIVEAKKLVEELRNLCAYDEMGQLAEAVSRRDPKDAKNRRVYAQYLIDTGRATAAIDLLTPLSESLAKGGPEFASSGSIPSRKRLSCAAGACDLLSAWTAQTRVAPSSAQAVGTDGKYHRRSLGKTTLKPKC